MAITRKFLDWKQPALVSATEYFVERYSSGVELDLSRVVAVTPGKRAGRQLLDTLVHRADGSGLRLLPPRIETIGRLPELLFPAQRPYASDLVQQLAWVETVRSAAGADLAQVFPELPSDLDWSRWLELGKLLWRLHRELAAEGLNFGDVVQQVQQLNRAEHARWKVLHEIQRRYLTQLDELDLWDPQTARLVAIEKQECHTDQDVVLIAVADMNRAMRAMLDQVAARVTVLVFAPRKYAARFDEHGCLASAKWAEATLDVDDAMLRFVEGPQEQADCVAESLAQWARHYASSEVVIGVPDERLVPYLERELGDCGVPLHHAAGQPVAQSAPYRLLEAISAYLQRRRYRDLARLVRHPDMFALLASWIPPPWLAELDAFYSDYLPVDLGDWPGASQQSEHLHRLVDHVDRLVEPLRGKPRRVDQWAPVIAGVLADIYDGQELDRNVVVDQLVLTAASAVREALQTLETPPARLAPVVSAVDALRITLDQLRDATSGIPAEPDAVELIGWLDLPLDLAPAVILTSLNEGYIPTSVNADLFLPNALRRRLQLVDNQRRYARDAYALEAILRTRPDALLIVSRRDALGDPLVPSRLLFATDPDTIARRVLRLCGAESEPPPAAPARPPQQLMLDLAGGREPDPPLESRDRGRGPAAGPFVEGPRTTSAGEGACSTTGAGEGACSTTGAGEGACSTTGAGEGACSTRSESRFWVPLPERAESPLTTLSVTALRTYLACPYRFYLRHVLRLRTLHDEAEELDAPAFGSLLHQVLDGFGQSQLLDCTDAEQLERFLQLQLDAVLQQQFGAKRLPAVNVQLGQLRSRLRAFASWQAAWAAQGWRLRYSEQECQVAPARFQLPGYTIQLKGRIDRVDYNQLTGQWAVLDYKSSDSAKPPRKAHQQGEKWIDLQLPLYRHLVGQLQIPSDALLGYILLPKDIRQVGQHLADWTLAELEEADAAAQQVLESIIAQRFWPPAAKPLYDDEFAGICQDKVFARSLPPAEPLTTGG